MCNTGGSAKFPLVLICHEVRALRETVDYCINGFQFQVGGPEETSILIVHCHICMDSTSCFSSIWHCVLGGMDDTPWLPVQARQLPVC